MLLLVEHYVILIHYDSIQSLRCLRALYKLDKRRTEIPFRRYQYDIRSIDYLG